MPIGTITIEDVPPLDPTQGDMQMRVEINFGAQGFDERSEAHRTIATLSDSIRRYFEMAGTATDRSEEPAAAQGEAHGV